MRVRAAALALVGMVLALGGPAAPAAAEGVGRLEGSYLVDLTVTKVEVSGGGSHPSAKVGNRSQVTLEFVMACPTGPCAATPRDVYLGPSTLALTSSGYTGSAPPQNTGGQCRFDVPTTVTLAVTDVAESAGNTVATAFTGTFRQQVASSCGSDQRIDGRVVVHHRLTATRVGVLSPGADGSGVAEPSAGSERELTAAPRSGQFASPRLASSVATWEDVSTSLAALLRNALLALLIALLLPFPATLFNSTLEANYPRIRRWLRRGRPEVVDRPRPRGAVVAARFAVLVLVTASLNALLDPALGWDRASAILVAGLAVSTAVVSLVAVVPARVYLRQRYQAGHELKLFPLALVFAGLCVLISRVTGYQPGYLYGVIAGFAAARELARSEKARLSLGTSGFLLLVAVVSFALRIPVHDAAVSSGGLALTMTDTVLAALFAAGISSNVIGLLPLRFLTGEHIFRWSRSMWTAVFALNVFVLLHALAGEAGSTTTESSIWLAVTLFAGFGLISVLFWGYFAVTQDKSAPVAEA